MMQPGTFAFGAILNMDTYIRERILVIWVEIFAYGVYAVLFSICLHLFRNRTKPHPWVIVATVLLFVLSTIKLGLDQASVVQAFASIGSDSSFNRSLDKAAVYIYVSANAVSDALLIYRCAIVWESRKFVLALPLLLSFASAIAGYSSQYTGSLFIILSMITNTLVTALIAGRIWWISRRLRAFLGSTYTEYTAAIAIIVESGLMCTISTVVFTVTYNEQSARWAAYYFSSQAIVSTLL
ncbi:hypothetical protein PTI98_008198 [Pleurotus ostreatus]|nr:hypothetical protein PTI98_008198 [Pleurotus ostreatus]